MSPVSQLYQRFRHLIHEGAKFGIVGGIGFLIVLVGSDVLRYDAGLGKYLAVTLGNVAATAFTFLGNRHWSFRHRAGAGTRRDAVIFFALNVVGLLIQYASIWLVTGPLGLTERFWYRVALVLGVGLGTVFRFWSYRKWVWVLPEVRLDQLRRGRHRKGRAAQPAPAVSEVRQIRRGSRARPAAAADAAESPAPRLPAAG